MSQPSPYTSPPPSPGPQGKGVRLGLILAATLGSMVLILLVAAVVLVVRSSEPSRPDTFDRPADSGPSDPAEKMPKTDPALAEFYDQQLDWVECGGGNQCADLSVPLDYEQPGGEKITVSVIRVPAEGDPQGALVINPGGPGGSGLQYAEAAPYVFTAPVLRDYDIVGFDPRGVGQSTPLECMNTEETDELLAFDPDPDTEAEEKQLDALIKRFGDGCVEESGDLAAHISTREVVRDLDVLRQALGQAKLDYFGASYGTLIGATYADMFPENAGRLVLDGAVNPALSNEKLSLEQGEGFETALRAYVADCVEQGDCVLGDSVDAGAKRIRTMLDDIELSPLPTSGDRELAVGNAFLGVIMPLYVKDYWPRLTAALEQAINDQRGDLLLELGDLYASRGPGGYSDNSMEVLYAVNCLDHSDSIPTSEVSDYFAEFEKASPTLGRSFAYSLSTCSNWPIQSGEKTEAMAAEGAPPIVVIGTTRDPATPMRWSRALADQLSSGVLIERDGDGHTGYNQGNSCVDEAVETFLIEGEAPEDGLMC